MQMKQVLFSMAVAISLLVLGTVLAMQGIVDWSLVIVGGGIAVSVVAPMVIHFVEVKLRTRLKPAALENFS